MVGGTLFHRLPARARPAPTLLPLFNLTTPPSVWRAFQARTYLGEFLKEKFDDVVDLTKLQLSVVSSKTGRKKILTPDGLFMSRACNTLWILEVKVNLEVRHLSSLEACFIPLSAHMLPLRTLCSHLHHFLPQVPPADPFATIVPLLFSLCPFMNDSG